MKCFLNVISKSSVKYVEKRLVQFIMQRDIRDCTETYEDSRFKIQINRNGELAH